MVKSLHFLFYLIFNLISLSLCYSKDEVQLNTKDSTFNNLLVIYKEAINHKSFEFMKGNTITQVEYDELIQSIKKSQPECITNFEENYKVDIQQDEFNSLVNAKIKIKDLRVTKVEEFSKCNVTYKMLICEMYYNKIYQDKLAIILLKTLESKYKIFNQISNLKSLNDEE